MRTRREVSAGGVLLREGRSGAEVCLASRRTRAGKLVWGLPKGLVEEGETPEEAAEREVREETGFEGAVRAPLGEVSYWYVWDGTRVRKTVHFFLMDLTRDEPGERDEEMEEIAWFPLSEAARVAGYDSEKDVLKRAAGSAAR